MRVISGKRKGYKLKTPKSNNIRPTEDRIKESLFNILNPITPKSFVLDGFAGTGSIGIEFLSRGADKVYFVDSSKESIDIIKHNLNHTKLNGIVLNMNIGVAINNFKSKNIYFDYIYLDPPFLNHQLLYNTLELIDREKILKNQGIIIIEHEKKLELEDRLFNLGRYDFRKYGNKLLSFYKLNQ